MLMEMHYFRFPLIVLGIKLGNREENHENKRIQGDSRQLGGHTLPLNLDMYMHYFQ
jgi:hypothetical protein